MNEKTDEHIVLRVYENVHVVFFFVFFSFIPQGNEKNQLSILLI